MFIKTLIVIILFAIIASLASALHYLFKDGGRSPRTVKALTYRIGISLALFFLLLLGYMVGILKPHGLKTDASKPPAAQTSQPAKQ